MKINCVDTNCTNLVNKYYFFKAAKLNIIFTFVNLKYIVFISCHKLR